MHCFASIKLSPRLDSTMPRFVVLHHTPGSRPARDQHAAHFDWMFEVDGVLRTWATPEIAAFDLAVETTATRLGDHRLEYLTYEGEISGDRGTVKQVISGTYTRRRLFSRSSRAVGQLRRCARSIAAAPRRVLPQLDGDLVK